MTLYRFEAFDLGGQREKGMIEAESLRQARLALRTRGLTPIAVDESERDGRRPTERWWQRPLSGRERVVTLRQLAVLLNGGVPLDEALAGIAEDAGRVAVRERLLAVRSEVLGGTPLARALARHPRDFPALYPALVEAGEKSGRLGWVLERLADYAEARDQLQGKVLMALVYPAVVTVVASGIVTFLMTTVVPQIVSVFDNNHQTLPWLTRALIAISDLLRHWGWAGVLILIGAGVGLRSLWQQPAWRLGFDRRLLGWPVLGRLAQGYNTERFASTLAILVGGGVPILASLLGAAQAMGNQALRQAVEQAAERVREGSSLARALEVQKCFPRPFLQLIRAGESTGRLPELLGQAARNEAVVLERRLMLLTTLMEPALILIMGTFVALIVLAILMPIIDLNQQVV